mmetsp:Transcript_21266/g.27461  ORF Transcript_21266/g.27461 Transcript_21266/m.27461 type:complete len:176 (-) Transcript_21266:137-664(-)|eukprot:CAMPEP_0198144802 /NCGR_PEP_ID=MMETSP1443-20131203/18681_1 /TAXON_ID=186043 /ORGANISM="Entomoneis sp., Strain CCMP2396" /LENGTH=175 /DNA_ID=CAMNT_0043808265 /DNA_START=116 /DNA_END=643 /DNA_ORIENTATION=-
MAFPGRLMQKCWHLVDAEGQTVGRVAQQIAAILKGKHKPTFMPHHDMGDHVVVINAEKVHFTGKKWKDKLYRWHTGYPGGLKQRTAREMLDRNPLQIMRKAIMGMTKKNNLRHGYLEKRLFLYQGPKHPHIKEIPESVPPLPKAPRKLNGTFHYGLDLYAHPDTFKPIYVSKTPY